MDEVTIGAITAVWHSDIDHARRWFDAVGEEYRALVGSDGDHDWNAYRRNLTEWAERHSFGAEVVDGFASYLERYSSSPMDVIAQLADPRIRDDLVSMYADAVEQAHPTAQ